MELNGRVWQQIVVDRRDQTSPYRQIANAIRHKIATNQVAPSTALPSVRGLADQVGVTPATVARAYRQLQSDGLVESQVGVGTVVSDTRRLVYQARRRSAEELERTLDAALTPLLQMGYAPSEVRAAVDRRLHRNAESHLAIVISDAAPVLHKYVGIMKRELAPLGVSVEGMLLEQLRAPSEESKQRLARTSRVLTSLGLLRRVQESLERCGVAPPISIMFTELSLATIERLSAIPKNARALVVSDERYRNSILGILLQHLSEEQVSVLHKLDETSLAEELAGCQVVVHSLGTTDLVRKVATAGHQTILMDYQVRQDAMAKLRESFVTDSALALA